MLKKAKNRYTKIQKILFRSLILLFLNCALTALSKEPALQQTGLVKVTVLSKAQKLENEKKKKQEEQNEKRILLLTAYNTLSDAIAADDLTTVALLFRTHPELKKYAYQNEGTPLHFARSKTMAHFLTEQIRFNPNICDEWGELPSKTILATKDQFFTNAEEKVAIAHYLASHESFFTKNYYQLKNNKNIHRKTCAFGLAALLITLDYYFFFATQKKTAVVTKPSLTTKLSHLWS